MPRGELKLQTANIGGFSHFNSCQVKYYPCSARCYRFKTEKLPIKGTIQLPIEVPTDRQLRDGPRMSPVVGPRGLIKGASGPLNL